MCDYVGNGDDSLLYIDKNFPNNKWLGVKYDSESLAKKSHWSVVYNYINFPWCSLFL